MISFLIIFVFLLLLLFVLSDVSVRNDLQKQLGCHLFGKERRGGNEREGPESVSLLYLHPSSSVCPTTCLLEFIVPDECFLPCINNN